MTWQTANRSAGAGAVRRSRATVGGFARSLFTTDWQRVSADADLGSDSFDFTFKLNAGFLGKI